MSFYNSHNLVDNPLFLNEMWNCLAKLFKLITNFYLSFMKYYMYCMSLFDLYISYI